MRYLRFFIVPFMLFFFGVHYASASLLITEIMYDPKGANTNHQWIEVYNPDASISIDGTKWRFNDGSSHYMNDKANFAIGSGSYVIITGDKATFLADHSGYSGMVIDTSMSLDKDGGTVALINDGATVASASYNSGMGASENGDSLQKQGSSWVAGTPTPGAGSQSSAGATSNTSGTSADESVTATTTSLQSTEVGSVTTKILSPKIVFAGLPFRIGSKTTGPKKEIFEAGKYIWSYGDGMGKVDQYGQPFEYTYQYSGEYVLSLEFYQSYYQDEPDAVDRMIIKVVPAEITIASVGDVGDPFVELENTSPYEVNLTNWKLVGALHSFIVPYGTSILANKHLRLSPKITGFTAGDLSTVKLLISTGEIVASYPTVNMQRNGAPESQGTYLPVSGIKNTSGVRNSSEEFPAVDYANGKDDSVVNLNDLSASAASAVTGSQFAWIGLVGIILFGTVAMVVARMMHAKKKRMDADFEQEISASDIAIVE